MVFLLIKSAVPSVTLLPSTVKARSEKTTGIVGSLAQLVVPYASNVLYAQG
jgi:hypothetical protein